MNDGSIGYDRATLQERNTTRVVMIGGAGDVGKVALKEIFGDRNLAQAMGRDQELNITLVTRKAVAKHPLVMELQDAYGYLRTADGRTLFNAVKLQTTHEPDCLSGADLVVMLADEKNFDPASKAQLQAKGLDPRSILSYGNKPLVEHYCEEILFHAEHAHVAVVTNQSDTLAMVARTILNPELVVGFGGSVDAARLRRFYEEHLMNTKGVLCPEDKAQLAKCLMIGYHNDKMIIGEDIPGVSPNIMRLLRSKTRDQGHKIATSMPGEVSTPSLLPGICLAKFIGAYAGLTDPIIEALNVVLNESALAENYGVPKGTGLSVPNTVAKGKITAVSNYLVDPARKLQLRAAAEEMNIEFEGVNSWAPPSRPANDGAHSAASPQVSLGSGAQTATA